MAAVARARQSKRLRSSPALARPDMSSKLWSKRPGRGPVACIGMRTCECLRTSVGLLSGEGLLAGVTLLSAVRRWWPGEELLRTPGAGIRVGRLAAAVS